MGSRCRVGQLVQRPGQLAKIPADRVTVVGPDIAGVAAHGPSAVAYWVARCFLEVDVVPAWRGDGGERRDIG